MQEYDFSLIRISPCNDRIVDHENVQLLIKQWFDHGFMIGS